MAFDLSSIKRNTAERPQRTLLYSARGVGKTTFAAEAPAPIFIPVEDGLGKLDVDAFPIPGSFDDVIAAISTLYSEEHQFQTVVVDSLDWLEPLIWNRVCRDLGLKSIESAGYGKGYVEALTHWRSFFEGLTALRNDRSMNVVMLAHGQVIKVEDPLLPAYDAHQIKLHKRAAALAEEYVDQILFAAVKTYTKTEDGKFNQDRTLAMTLNERVIYTSPNPAYVAKNRHNLPPEIPMVLGKSWIAYDDALKASTATAQNQSAA